MADAGGLTDERLDKILAGGVILADEAFDIARELKWRRTQPSPREAALEKALRRFAVSTALNGLHVNCRICGCRWDHDEPHLEHHRPDCALSPAQKGEPGC